MEKGDFVIWSNMLPHAGGVNCLKDHWRLHTYVRYLPLNGDAVDKDSRRENLTYKDVVKKSVTTGLRPERFSTGNSVQHGGGEKNVEEEDYLKNPPKFSELGKKLTGQLEWEEEEKKKKK